MFGFLEDIWHGILDLPYTLVNLLIESLNGWILILATAAKAVLALLPGFPAIPTLPSDVVGGVAWFLPLGPMLAVFTAFVTAWIIWVGIQTLLRWARFI